MANQVYSEAQKDNRIVPCSHDKRELILKTISNDKWDQVIWKIKPQIREA